MAMTNFSKDGTHAAYGQLFCSEKLSLKWDKRSTRLSFSVQSFLTITTILGNTLIQVAVHKETSLHPPTKLLLRTLSASDLCVGLTGNPFFCYLHVVFSERTLECLSLCNDHWFPSWLLCFVRCPS